MSPLVQTLGGVGLFLFGMAVMTSGLRKLAGDRLRQWLAASTRTPLSGVVTGATVTALVQSSSATTVAAIGFVGAGLITFTQSLGIIFGANIGTTITGWMVALLGFKLHLSSAALPLLFVAALCYLFKQNRFLRGLGKALAGFCLIFVGIGYLQDGLEGYRDIIDLSQWRAASFGGRALLVLVGVVLTLVTQSSSATVATAITALSASILDLSQASAVIIGADIGTTATAALATIGGTTASRRTGFAHVIYNCMTGIIAFLILPAYLAVLERMAPDVVAHSAEVVAVSFHSFFNALGVILVLPFTAPFGRLIEHLIPERSTPLASAFDPKLLEGPQTATAGLEFGGRQIAMAILGQTANVLDPKGKSGRPPAESLESAFGAIEKGREFAIRIGRGGPDEAEVDASRVFASIHLLDHAERLGERAGDEKRAHSARLHEKLRRIAESVAALFDQFSAELSEGTLLPETVQSLTRAANELEEDKSQFRHGVIEAAARGELPPDQLDGALDAHRWLRRTAYHAARIAHYADHQE